LHTGRHYPDDLSDDGLIYHYPTTHRPSGRDAAEVQATKNAAALSLPIFVILPGMSSAAKRSIRLGWVVDFDDENKQFLILFGERAPDYQAAASQETTFVLTGGSTPRKTTAKARPGQQRFRFQVLAKYGCKCAVCTISHPSLMKAAHICGKAHNGSDDWRNGLPLCSTHHDAFDAHLFTINPDNLAIETMPTISPASIGITTKSLTPIHQQPHPRLYPGASLKLIGCGLRMMKSLVVFEPVTLQRPLAIQTPPLPLYAATTPRCRKLRARLTRQLALPVICQSPADGRLLQAM
jgi:putative restriction endonuclease